MLNEGEPTVSGPEPSFRLSELTFFFGRFFSPSILGTAVSLAELSRGAAFLAMLDVLIRLWQTKQDQISGILLKKQKNGPNSKKKKKGQSEI